MTNKSLFLSLSVFAVMALATPSFASSSSSTHSPCAKDSSSFEYEKEIFQRHAVSNLDEDMPSLAQVYQDAVTRKTHIDSLYSYLKTHKLGEDTKRLFRGHVDFLRTQRNWTQVTQSLPDDIFLLHALKNDYAVERDLMGYFLSALEKIATNPTQDQLEELYAQTVYTVRLNLQSLGDRVFYELHKRYPDVFYFTASKESLVKMMSVTKIKNLQEIFSDEEKAYIVFTMKLKEDASPLYGRDTVKITHNTKGLLSLPSLTSSHIIFDLNSLSFYLNVERALLAACDTLQFRPEEYGFYKPIESHKDKFALSSLIAYHNKGLFSEVFARTYTQGQLDLFKRNKEKLLESILLDCANANIADMLKRLGVTQSTPPKEAQKKTTKSKKRAASARQKKAPAPKQAPLFNAPTSSILSEIDDIDVDTTDVIDLEKDLSQHTSSSSDEETKDFATAPTSALLTRHVPHLDDYTYKRNVAWTPQINRVHYIFNDLPFEMQGAFFDRDLLLQIKTLTHHKPDSSKLPNLASAHLRFHYTVGGENKTHDFIPEALYLSGGNRFIKDNSFRRKVHIQNAYHNVLSHQDQRAFTQEDPVSRWARLSKCTTQSLSASIAQGPWRVNCADSEGIMLLDLNKLIPTYLAQLASEEDGPLHIQGVVLGASTYRDPCWRCRNLFQGWQWGLENALSVWIQGQNLPITIAQDMPTLVFGFGEISPDSHDFFPPRTSHEEIRLERPNPDMHVGNTHKLRLVKMEK